MKTFDKMYYIRRIEPLSMRKKLYNSTYRVYLYMYLYRIFFSPNFVDMFYRYKQKKYYVNIKRFKYRFFLLNFIKKFKKNSNSQLP